MRTIDDICYNLKVFPNTTTEDDNQNLICIAKVLQKLPTTIQEQIFDTVIFICLSGVNGVYERMHFPSSETVSHVDFILINFSSLEAKEESFKATTIAHEIAHFILEHHDGGVENEKAADDLCESWGFGRAYENYDFC